MSEAPALDGAGRRDAARLAVSGMYERHARTLYGLCRMLLRDPHEAEDALQATFLAAHGALLRGSAPRNEAAWLTTIARNECRGRIRTTMMQPTNAGGGVLADVADPGPTPEERLRDPEVSGALAQLPETQREAVVLHDVFGFKAREVGTVLGMSVPAVEALLFRGRRQLRLRLHPAHGALVVPLGVRDAITAAIPGFAADDGVAIVSGGAGAAGAGFLAKLAGAPAAAKVTAGVVAVASAGSVAVVEAERAREDAEPPTRLEMAGGGGPASTQVGLVSVTGTTASAADGARSASGGTSGAGGSSGPGGGDHRSSDSGSPGVDRTDRDDEDGDASVRGAGAGRNGAGSDEDDDDRTRSDSTDSRSGGDDDRHAADDRSARDDEPDVEDDASGTRSSSGRSGGEDWDEDATAESGTDSSSSDSGSDGHGSGGGGDDASGSTAAEARDADDG